ncbi:hypothetical protein J421_3697 [Gemmatirosa kalamazoonensis]|uniref:Uncharacterized protein n=1 Tax=Gemmatirosa kalamazoonensis TaxID=861299 RepID=W0RJI8_9BACT|nr:hypothetical protein [Gemmatirosa kalamazoonensis]AHG91234.1 hypothetical protein J421_3697 [Gemmatirosa kalamazoonensis]
MDPAPAPTAPYGPNTPAIRRFLQRFAALGEAEWDAAAATFATLEPTRRFAAADRALADVVERLDRTRERDAVVGPILQITRPRGASGEPHPVAAAALAAALGLLVRDALPEPDFATLYAPFASLIWVDAL